MGKFLVEQSVSISHRKKYSALFLFTQTLIFIQSLSFNYESANGYRLNKFSPRHTIYPDPKYDNNKDRGQITPNISEDDNNEMENKIHQDPNLNLPMNLDEAEESQWQEEEPECPKGLWWHIRGRACVPLKCLGGNKFRDVETGKCIRKSLRKFNKSPISYFAYVLNISN